MPANRILRFRVPLGFLFAAWYVGLIRQTAPQQFAACVVFVVAGCALRSWAAGYLLKGKRVAVGGPYAYVRNPLYLGSFIIGIGFCIALYRQPLHPFVLLFWMSFLVGFILLYAAKGKSEEVELGRSLGPDYQAYRERVPAFLPVHGKVRGLGMQHFSFELYRRNREYQCIWGSLAVLALLLWRRQHGF